jgi:hypothetical protein
LIHFFDSLAIGDRVSKAVIARDRFRDRNGIGGNCALKESFRALVRIEKSKLKVQNGVPNHAETKMTRFDNSSVYWTYRNLTDSLSLDPKELGIIYLFGATFRAVLNPAMSQQR